MFSKQIVVEEEELADPNIDAVISICREGGHVAAALDEAAHRLEVAADAIAEVGSPEDLVRQNKMQRRLGQLTGTCFQRCVGMDAFNSLYSVTYEIDEKHGTPYHERLLAFLSAMQENNYVVGGAMTDVKGDRSKAPHEQDDPDLGVNIVVVAAQGGACERGFEVVTVDAGQAIVREGERDRDMYFVLEGDARIVFEGELQADGIEGFPA